MLASTPNPMPSYQTFETHYNNGMTAFDQGRNREATVHLRHAAQVLSAIVRHGPKGETAEKNTARLEKIVGLIERIKDRPDEVPVLETVDAQLESRMNEALKNKGSEKYRGVEKYVREEKVHFDDIIGHEEAKQEFHDLVTLPVKFREEFAKRGLAGGGGVLLYGPAGTGKSQLAKAAATSIGAHFLKIELCEIRNKHLGESEKSVSEFTKGAIELAKKTDKPVMVYFDEVDALLETAETSDSPAQRGILSQFQSGVDDIRAHNEGGGTPVLLVGTTNFPWVLSDAIVRRLTDAAPIYVGLPGLDDRKRMFLKKSEKLKGDMIDVDFDELARRSEGLSGDDITKICQRTGKRAVAAGMETGQIALTQERFLDEVGRQKPSAKPEDVERFEQWRRKSGQARSAKTTSAE